MKLIFNVKNKISCLFLFESESLPFKLQKNCWFIYLNSFFDKLKIEVKFNQNYKWKFKI